MNSADNFSTSVNLGIIVKQRAKSIYKELFRKSIHICSAFVPLLLKYAYTPCLFLLGFALVCYTISELLRLSGHPLPLISKITETAARSRDEKKFVLGPVTLVLGIIIAALFLPLKVATIGIFALSFGDGTASLMGKLFGKITIPYMGGKTVAGSLSCFLAVYVSCFAVSGNCLVSLFVALFAMVIEVLPLADFDNLIIPFLTGNCYLIVQQILFV